MVRTLINPARLDAFVDFNADGDWSDAGEQIFASKTVTNRVNVLSFAVPAFATNRTSYARFRLSSAGGLGPTGDANDGEVEDYRVRFGTNGVPVVIRGISVDGEGRAVLAHMRGYIRMSAEQEAELKPLLERWVAEVGDASPGSARRRELFLKYDVLIRATMKPDQLPAYEAMTEALRRRMGRVEAKRKP